jgi:hypothetical protein
VSLLNVELKDLPNLLMITGIYVSVACDMKSVIVPNIQGFPSFQKRNRFIRLTIANVQSRVYFVKLILFISNEHTNEVRVSVDRIIFLVELVHV